MTPFASVERTHAELVLDYLREHGSVTPLDALNEFGCFRLGARIYDLRKAGHRIVTEMEEGARPNTRFARYSLAEYQIALTERSEPLREQRPEAT